MSLKLIDNFKSLLKKFKKILTRSQCKISIFDKNQLIHHPTKTNVLFTAKNATVNANDLFLKLLLRYTAAEVGFNIYHSLTENKIIHFVRYAEFPRVLSTKTSWHSRMRKVQRESMEAVKLQYSTPMTDDYEVDLHFHSRQVLEIFCFNRQNYSNMSMQTQVAKGFRTRTVKEPVDSNKCTCNDFGPRKCHKEFGTEFKYFDFANVVMTEEKVCQLHRNAIQSLEFKKLD